MTDFGPLLALAGAVVIVAVVLYEMHTKGKLSFWPVKQMSILDAVPEKPAAQVPPQVTVTAPAPVTQAPAPAVVPPAPTVVPPVLTEVVTIGVGGFPLPLSGEGMQAYMQRAGIDVGAYQWQMQAEAAQHPGHGWDEIADRVMHPEHFYTQADLDTIAAAQRAPVGVPITDVSGASISLPGPGRYRTMLSSATTFSFHLDKPGRFSAVDCDGHQVPMTASASNGAATNGNSIALSVDAGDFTVTLSPLGDPGRIFVDLG